MCQRPLTPSVHGSLANNQLCGINRADQGTYTSEGITKLCEGLKESAVTSLKCAATPECPPFRQRPLTLLPSFTAPICSIGWNKIGDMGASALAAILNKTMITKLECAATPECSLLCQRPLTRLFCMLTAWPTTGCAASSMEAAPTPPRASPSSARRSREAP